LGLPLPLLAAQILWINLVTDGIPNIALTVEPEEKEIMKESPQERDKPILDLERKTLIFLISLVTAAMTLVIFYVIWKTTGDLAKARTIAFTLLAVDSLLYVFSCRSLRRPIWKTRFFSNKYLIAVVSAGFVLQLTAVYWTPLQTVLRTVALNAADWGIILAAGFLVIALIEATKYVFIVERWK